MKRVAIPISKGLLSENFGQCNHYQIFTCINGCITAEDVQLPPKNDMEKMPDWAANVGITDIITHKIDKNIIGKFQLKRINLFVGVAIKSVSEILDEFVQGRLRSDESVITEILNNQ